MGGSFRRGVLPRVLLRVAMVGACLGGVGWIQRERSRRLLSTLRAGYLAGHDTVKIAQVLSRDVLEFLSSDLDREELPRSLNNLLLLLQRREVLDALAVVSKSAAEGIIQNMPRDPEHIQKVTSNPAVERFAVVLVRTAVKEAVRTVIQKMDEQRLNGFGGESVSKLSPETVGQWVKNDAIRSLIVEVVSSTILNSTRAKKEVPASTVKHAPGRSGKGMLRSSTFTGQRMYTAAPSVAMYEKKNSSDYGEKILMTALQDRELVRAIASESVRSYLTTKDELRNRKALAQNKARGNSLDMNGSPDNRPPLLIKGGEDAEVATLSSDEELDEPTDGPSTAWWLIKTLASTAW
eukprot:CAMPEP_0184743008 /NCGR_PEP_ID=MMETSP0315-20130426/5913_1 /TAXON_ID=101924 /ORGANISM="Rhodosorus marinus, Strain UTEX LB 2760" /LENGTH=349 /DNA_ID=CAMNT_0027214095 /DNA_START=482 /DNA_END=1528 /DNA_ORIENTATION=+